jgi:glycosyltransferase involved in cell wall biosynthesis
MHSTISISVVIPTYNRRKSLLRSLSSLNNSTYPILEVIIVDGGTDKINDEEMASFANLIIKRIETYPSVCAQRNLGIKNALGDWVFLCDDDIEVPCEYLKRLMIHLITNPNVGAVSGIVLQLEAGKWTGQYPIDSSLRLIWNFVFQLSFWGELSLKNSSWIISKIKMHYKAKGNHVSKAGWPVVSNFSGDFFSTPIYGLGASLVRKQWLLESPFDEILDANGIGDNYGVAVGFPSQIRVVSSAFVYHHRELLNRELSFINSGKRILALHYFVKTRPALKNIKVRWLLWSLVGMFLSNLLSGKVKASLVVGKTIFQIVFGSNPYLRKLSHIKYV